MLWVPFPLFKKYIKIPTYGQQTKSFSHHDAVHLSSTRLRHQLSGQDIQHQRTRSLTKISQHENPVAHTNIKVVNWITKYKQYK